jgi:glycosyltransferase involved in cell wall biosynthesis
MRTISAVISTFERPDACERALLSALAQAPAPIEVLICDDGSADVTAERFTAWERRDPRVRYLRLQPNRGTPGATRNLGTTAARGEWVAYLDDDDEWLPGKLSRQLELAEDADVIATNALRGGGQPYFTGSLGVRRPSRADIVADNPLIVSTVMARRRLVLDAGGFMTEGWARGVSDYALWLSLADRGARFALAPEPLARYDSDAADRMSAARFRQELAVARLAWRRVRADPGDPLVRRAAMNRSVAAARLGLSRRPRA